MPGIIGGAALAREGVRDLPFDRAAAHLRCQPGLVAAFAAARDGRAVLGAVDLRRVPGSGVPSPWPNGSLAVVHGEITSFGGAPDPAARVLERYFDDPGSLARLEGAYALALWDAPARALVLSTDRFGLRNVYYVLHDGRLCFAPLVSALLALVPAARAVDTAAVADFLAFEHVLGDATLLREVRALPPATIARWDARGLDLERYWVPRYRANGARRVEEHAVELGRRLDAAVERAVSGPARAGIPVSGGLDSRLILAVARGVAPAPMPCFTYGVSGSDDLRYGALVARAAGAPHHAFELRPGFIGERARDLVRLTDGMHLALNVHATVLQACARWCETLVLGNGGDCLLDRLWWWADEPDGEDDYVERMYERLNLLVSPALGAEFLSPALLAELTGGCRQRLGRRLALYTGTCPSEAADAFNVGERHWRWVLQGVPAQSTHVEFREPFYDYGVVEVALGVPASLRAGRRLHVELIRRRAPDLARIPRQGGAPLTASRLATRVRSRLKRARRTIHDVLVRRFGGAVAGTQRLAGFADYDFELRGASRALLEQVVLADSALDRGWYRPDGLRALVREHLERRRNHGRVLGAIATLELWLQEHVDAAPPGG